jgi:hypothetical protein
MGNSVQHWVTRVLERVPAVSDLIGPDEEPYAAFCFLAAAIRAAVEREELGSPILAALWVLAEMAQSNDSATLNLLAVGALEGLAGCPAVIRRLRPMMPQRLRRVFDYTLLGWYGDPLDRERTPYNLDVAPDEDAVSRAVARVLAADDGR